MNIPGLLISFLISFGLLIIAVCIHEFAHGWVAYKLGDTTAKLAGRLTLNPIAHIDLFWTLILPLSLFIITQGGYVFGAAKPVPINYAALRNPKRDIIWIGLSGPAANFLLAFVFSALFRLTPVTSLIALILKHLIYINILLGIFNLIPIPPLDGSRILMGILPRNFASKYALIEPFGFVIIVLLMGTIFNLIIIPVIKFISDFLRVPF